MSIKLIIKDPGLFLNIPGITQFRSPGILDITKLDIKFINSWLKSNGIEKYDIIAVDEDRIKKEKEKIKALKNNDDIENNFDQGKIISALNNQKESINNIEQLLLKFLSSSNNDSNNQNISINKKVIDEEEDMDDFIPSINLDNVIRKSKK
jgi:hypothetical protein